MRVIISAAGTGGHINPGIAIANKIKEKEPNSEIIFVGTDRGLENDLVPRAGYELKHINAYGFDRTISLDNIKKMYQTFHSIKEAKKIIEQFKPDVIIGTGGYICVPVGLAAKKKKVPVVLHESNAFPGVAVKMLSNKASKVLVGFEDAKVRLPKAKQVIVTGTPTKVKKIKISDARKQELLKENKLNNNKPIVLFFGGSQGAKSINNSLLEIISKKQNQNYQILWAAGPAQYEQIKKDLKEKHSIEIDNIENVSIVPYIYNMEEIMNVSDIIVARSGAMTLTEIALVGKPAIFIPLPSMSANRQEDNARVFEKEGAAKVILNNELNGEVLQKAINSMIKDKNKLIEMGENAKKLAIYNVEDRIYEELEKCLK